MKLAIAIGHNRYTGARSITGVDEWTWNRSIALKMAQILEYNGITSQIFVRDPNLGYTAAMKKHARQIKEAGCTQAIELHFNYFRSGHPANGFEFLYWWASLKSRKAAQAHANNFGAAFPSIKPRSGRWFKGWVSGAKMLWLKSWNKIKADQRRGAEFCYYTHCPAVIAEPGFASNPQEWERLENQIDRIAYAYCKTYIDMKNSE